MKSNRRKRQFGLNEENVCGNELKKEDGGKQKRKCGKTLMGFIFYY